MKHYEFIVEVIGHAKVYVTAKNLKEALDKIDHEPFQNFEAEAYVKVFDKAGRLLKKTEEIMK